MQRDGGIHPNGSKEVPRINRWSSGGKVPYGSLGEVPMLSKWMFGNSVAARVVTSAGGMTALAVVLAAPSKWV